MTFAERRRAAAIATLRDPAASDADRAKAQRELTARPDVTRLTTPELNVLIDTSERLAGRERSDDYYQRHELALAAQRYADERRAELDATACAGPRQAVPRCRRCAEFGDSDLAALREAVEQDRLGAPLVEALPEPEGK